MRNLSLRFLFVLSVCLSAWVVAGIAEDVKSIAAAVDAHYNHLRSLEAQFTETYRGSGMDRSESGTLHRLLEGHRDKLDVLAHALLSAESLNEQEIRDATGLADPAARACTT